jgi:hypothetical protein
MSWLGLCSAIPVMGAVQVVSATYGGNCGAPSDNARAALGAACDTRAHCDYVIDYRVLGDPAPGCAKTFEAKWACSTDGETQAASVAAEAGFGSHIVLSCAGGHLAAQAVGGAGIPIGAHVETTEQQNARLRQEVDALTAQVETLESAPRCPAPPQLSDFQGRLTGRYADDKADGAPIKDFPAAPAGDVADWLNWLNAGLHDVLEKGMTYSELTELANLERDRCQAVIYCEIALRRQAIAYLVPGHRP